MILNMEIWCSCGQFLGEPESFVLPVQYDLTEETPNLPLLFIVVALIGFPRIAFSVCVCDM